MADPRAPPPEAESDEPREPLFRSCASSSSAVADLRRCVVAGLVVGSDGSPVLRSTGIFALLCQDWSKLVQLMKRLLIYYLISKTSL